MVPFFYVHLLTLDFLFELDGSTTRGHSSRYEAKFLSEISAIIVNMIKIQCNALDTFKCLTSNGIHQKSVFVGLQGPVYINARTSSVSSIGGGKML